jgi:O-antigen/teichoic acid export membrane protein
MIGRLKDIFTSSLLYLVAAALPALINFLLIPLYSHYLSPAEYGLISLVTLVQSLSIVLVGMGLDGAFNRFFFDHWKDKKALGKLLGSVLMVMLALAGLGWALLELLGAELWELLFKNETFSYDPLGRMAYLTAVGTVFYGVLLVYYKNSEKPKSYLWLSLLFWLSIVVGISLGMVYWEKGVTGAVAGRMLGSLGVGIGGLAFLALQLPLRFDPQWIRKIFRYGFPLAVYLFILTVSQQLDRWMIERHVSLTDLGHYHLAIMIASALSLGAHALHNVLAPRMYHLLTENEAKHAPQVKRMLHFFAASLTGIAILWLVLSKPLIDWMSPDSYEAASSYVGILILAQIPHFLFINYTLPIYFYQKTAYLPLISLVMLVVGLIGFSWALPIWGVLAAAWVFLGIKLIQLGTSILLNRYLRFDQKSFYPGWQLTAGILGLMGIMICIQVWQGISP